MPTVGLMGMSASLRQWDQYWSTGFWVPSTVSTTDGYFNWLAVSTVSSPGQKGTGAALLCPKDVREHQASLGAQNRQVSFENAQIYFALIPCLCFVVSYKSFLRWQRPTLVMILSWLRNPQWGCERRCYKSLSVHLQCRMGGRAGDAMRLASSSSSSTSSISTLLLSFTTLSLLLVITEAGTHLDEPWFRWRDGNVNFYFKVVAKIASFLKKHNVDHC